MASGSVSFMLLRQLVSSCMMVHIYFQFLCNNKISSGILVSLLECQYRKGQKFINDCSQYIGDCMLAVKATLIVALHR